MAFHKCEDGKKYLDSMRIALQQLNSYSRSTYTDAQQHYNAGFDDRIREQIFLVDAYREYTKKRLSNNG